MASILSVNTSSSKGVRKESVASITVRPEHGAEGDAHAGEWHRQLSLLAVESIREMEAKGLSLQPGDFAENLTVEGLEVAALPVGTRLLIGQVELEITQIGKQCHAKCAIYRQVGDCIMPRQGVFAKVLAGGELRPGQEIFIREDLSRA